MEELQRPTGQTPTLYFNTYSTQAVWSSDLAVYPLRVAQYNGVWDS